MADYIPIDALFGETFREPNPEVDPRPDLHAAEVILAHDIMSGEETVVFGREVLEGIAETGDLETIDVLTVGIDAETDDLEKLIALVVTVKGRHDYVDP